MCLKTWVRRVCENLLAVYTERQIKQTGCYFYVKKARPVHPDMVYCNVCNVCLASTILKPQPSMSRQPSSMKTLHYLIYVFEDVGS